MTDLANSRAAKAMLRDGISRRIVAEMMRRNFPGASDNERAGRGAPVLGISHRHFLRLLNLEHDAPAPVVLALLVLSAGEAALTIMYGRDR